MESLLSFLFVVLIFAVPLAVHARKVRKSEARAREAAEKGKLFSEGPQAQHPHVDIARCIGCGSCVNACPEGDVLAVVAGTSAIVNGYKCIGHGLCAEVCPVGAIEMVMARPSVGADMPQLSPEYETTVPNLFIVGELGGLALIKNAVNQGREAVDIIAARLAAADPAAPDGDGIKDICVVGAGPGGISASLRAIERKLSYVTLEQDSVGGTVAKYPRRKLVMTSPVEFPMYGRFRKLEISKESLMEFWADILRKCRLHVNTNEKVESIVQENGGFSVRTAKGNYRSRAVILAMGRRGTPRKLGIPGEESPKVMYSLIEADAYTGFNILVVGGGDSAIEAAVGLSRQKGNRVMLSYRKDKFSRIKERNAQTLKQALATGRLSVVYNSNPVEIREKSVLLDVAGELRELPNDYVWVFAGGTPPGEFLKKVGVQCGPRDLTGEAQTLDSR